MADLELRKFESFDLKKDNEYIHSVEKNNYNDNPDETEDYLVGYRTGAKESLSQKREFKIRLEDARGVHYNTTEYWVKNNQIAKAGDIYIYSDALVTDSSGNTFVSPQIKIGTGNAWLSDLRFINQDATRQLGQHIRDNNRHINAGERESWNNKLNVRYRKAYLWVGFFCAIRRPFAIFTYLCALKEKRF